MVLCSCFGRGRKRRKEQPATGHPQGTQLVMTKSQPANIGILAAEVYFPNTCVRQADLEVHDGVPSGKYTVGLGQEAMAVVLDNEDVNSICLTVVSNLMERYGMDPNRIGRLEVGTETIQDKSKSVKSYLMQLFPNNTDICGVDNVNACYGGTAALLNSVAWVESGDWDGRLAMVVIGDIAIYEKGPARPTGGAGAVAMLIGPDAPVVVERGTAAHFMQHRFDFYKPNPCSEYPIVDGPDSVVCYLRALDACYNGHLEKLAKIKHTPPNLNDFDHVIFHSPYGKLVQKSFGRLFLNDALRDANLHPQLRPYRDAVIETTYSSRELDGILASSSQEAFKVKALPSRLIPNQVGNCYCASLYAGLVSLLCQIRDENVTGRRVGMFSYGSGLASTMFSLLITGPLIDVVPPLKDINLMLSKRTTITADEFDRILLERESMYCARDWAPKAPIESLRPGTFYLELVDDKFRRFYNRTS